MDGETGEEVEVSRGSRVIRPARQTARLPPLPFLLYKPDVYAADFSAQTFLTSERELSEVTRSRLEFVPEKVLFGTDAFPIMPEVGWEELVSVTTKSAREALALSLTGMMRDGEITRKGASELARMVMRDNALKLYGFKSR